MSSMSSMSFSTSGAKFYCIVSLSELEKLMVNGYLSIEDNEDCQAFKEWEKPMDNWMMLQMRKRLHPSVFSGNETSNFPHFLFTRREDICDDYVDMSSNVVFEIELPPENVVFFDDNDYVTVVNDMCSNTQNGTHYAFLAASKEEAEQMQNASQDEIVASWEKMFDIDRPKDTEYCGEISLRAMTPYISVDMIKVVYMSK